MIVAGFGFTSRADTSALAAALAAAQAGAPEVTALATLADKAPALEGLARGMGLPLIRVTAADLERIVTVTRSAASLAARATGSVAEATALAAAGPGAYLATPRHLSPDRMATCAIAVALPDRSLP